MRQYIKFIILLLLAVLILWWFGRNLVTSWTDVGRSLASVDWRLLAAGIAAVSITYLQRAYRWRTLLAPLTKAGLRPLFAATTVGFGAVFLFGRMGEVVRPVVLPLYDRRVKPTGSFVTIMVERLCDVVAIVVLFAVNLLWFPAPPGRETQLASIRTAGLILLILTAVGVACLVWFERRSKSVIPWLDVRFKRWRFVPNRLAHALTHLLEQLAAALTILADSRELARTIAWTSIIWIFNTLANWLVILAFHLPFGLRENIFVMGWSLVGSLVPTPGGAAGAFHAATAAGLIFLNRPDLDANKSAAIAIMLHLVAFAPAVVWGLYYFLRGDVSFKRLQELTTAEEIEHSIEKDDEPRVTNETMSNELNAVGVRN
ncbi:MAG: glycosyltransferase 2 family protein [Acidobacteriota bacterium]|nr:glycosyltransferase 2 family protein [Acidobacteriota bacterium]